MSRLLTPFSIALIAIAAIPSFAQQSDQPVEKPVKADFKKDVKPILKQYCVRCHNDQRSAGQINLASDEKLLTQGNDEAKLIVPGKPDESVLIWSLDGSHNMAKMPKGMNRPQPAPADGSTPPAPWGKKQIAVLRQWVKDGAKIK